MNIKSVPFVDLSRQVVGLEQELADKFLSIAKSGQFVLGEELKQFEHDIADFCQTKYALGVANGTDALILALRALDITTGDEVITSPNSFIATAGAIDAVSANIKFVDVSENLNIDPTKIEAAITAKTKAIIAVHLTGRPAPMLQINAIAKKHGLYVIEDAAQAIGAKLDGKSVGSLGDIAAFSLHPLKNLNVFGDGGFITTNNETCYKKMAMDRNHGLVNRDTSLRWGLNSRLDEIQASIANIKLKKLNDWTQEFRNIASLYRSGLADVVTVPVDKDDEFAVYHNFVIYAARRDELIAFLESKYAIQTKIHYPVLLHLQPAAECLGYKKGDFPVAEHLAEKMMSLPIYPGLTKPEIDYVIRAINEFYERTL